MKILIAYDGSTYAEEALADLQFAGLPVDTEATVLTVTDTWELPNTTELISSRKGRFVHPTALAVQKHLDEVKEKAHATVDKVTSRLRKSFPGWCVKEEVLVGKPAWEIIKCADALPADLVVIGSHGRGAIGRALLGSVSQKVLNEAHCSVRIVKKRENADRGPLRLLAAVDGSANADAMVKEIAARKWPEDTLIRLIAVDDPFKQSSAGYISWDLEKDMPKDSEAATEWLEKVIGVPSRILEAEGLTVEHEIKWGDAGNTILAEAKEWKPDSIFMGARGLGRFERFSLGSVSNAVAARSGCTIEIVRIIEES